MNDWDARIDAEGSGFKAETIGRSLAERLRAPLTSTSLDRWALARIQGTVRSAPIRFALWDGFELAAPVHPPVGDDRLQESPGIAQLGLGSGSEFRRGLHVRRRRDPRRSGRPARGDLPRLGDDQAAALVAVAAIERRARREGERPPPLRSRQRVLSALARSRDGLHLRVFPDAGRHARGGADRQDGSGLPEAPAAAGRTRDRGGMRVGIAGAVHGPAVRRHGPRVQCLGRADRLRAAIGRAEQGSPIASSSSRTTIARSAGQYDAFVSVGMLEHVGAGGLSDARRRDRSLADRVAAAGCCISSAATGRPRSTRGSASGFSPGPIRRRCARCSSTCSSRRTCRCSTSRTCGCTTRRRSSTGAAGSTPPPARWRRCSTRRSSAPGGSIWPARRRRSRPARCSCFRWCSRAAAATRFRGRASAAESRRSIVDTCDVADRRRRPGGLDLRVEAPAGRPRRHRHRRATFPRDKVCAGWITPQVDRRTCGSTSRTIARGRTFQPITGFRVGLIGGGETVETTYGRPGQLRHPPLRVRSLPAAAIRAHASGSATRSPACVACAATGSSTSASERRCWSGPAVTSVRWRGC